MVDLTKYTAGTACKKMGEGLRKMGFDVTVWDPKTSKEHGYPECWYLISEEVPYEGLICLSNGGSIYCGEWDNYDYKRKPEFKVLNAKKYYCEPYYSYMLGFVKD